MSVFSAATGEREPPNTFGVTTGRMETQLPNMSHGTRLLDETSAPTNRPVERLDVQELGPPEPLQRTLELLGELDDDVVLVQRNDRAPQFLYPKLDDRGYTYETVESDDAIVTAIWREVDE